MELTHLDKGGTALSGAESARRARLVRRLCGRAEALELEALKRDESALCEVENGDGDGDGPAALLGFARRCAERESATQIPQAAAVLGPRRPNRVERLETPRAFAALI